MPRKRRQPLQTKLFEDELPQADFDKSISKPRLQKEKAIMRDLQQAATALGLPCIHIQNFCGNHFSVTCPQCGTKVLAHCKKILNVQLAGHHDIIGIAWTIETKHKTTKRKPQEAKPSILQQARIDSCYSPAGVPSILVNESNISEALLFLRKLADAKRIN